MILVMAIFSRSSVSGKHGASLAFWCALCKEFSEVHARCPLGLGAMLAAQEAKFRAHSKTFVEEKGSL
jgi:hypothetical protein